MSRKGSNIGVRMDVGKDKEMMHAQTDIQSKVPIDDKLLKRV